jgi:hypothetical protein
VKAQLVYCLSMGVMVGGVTLIGFEYSMLGAFCIGASLAIAEFAGWIRGRQVRHAAGFVPMPKDHGMSWHNLYEK